MSFKETKLIIQKRKESFNTIIEEKLIKLSSEEEHKLKKTFSYNNTFSNVNTNKIAPYYSNVIQRQNTQSPNHSVLLHDFVDDKKVTYKDITNRIDINELSSKIKNIIINIQRIKSCDKIKVNHNLNNLNNKINISNEKPKIYHRKTKSGFSYRQSNSSFTTENESKTSCSVKNIFVNKNITYKKKQKNKEVFSFNLNLNQFYNNKYNNLENKKYENEKYYSKTLREYLNEQVNKIKYKRNNLNENNINNINENDHNYSIDNNKDIFDKNDNKLSAVDVDNILIVSDKRDKDKDNNTTIKIDEKGINFLTENNTKNSCCIKSKNSDKNLNYINNNKSSFLNFKQNNIKKNSKKKINKKQNNTFRNSHINLNLIKHKTVKNFNSNFNKNILNDNNINLGKTQHLNKSNLNNYILSKPFKINSKINKNIIKKNKSFKSLSIINVDKYDKYIVNKENINTYNICKTKINVEKTKTHFNLNKSNNSITIKAKILSKKKDKNVKNIKFENKQNKRKNYSEIIRNKIDSTSQRKIKVKVGNKKTSS